MILLLLEVGRVTIGTQVRWREPGRLLGKNLTIDVVKHAWRGAVVDVIGVVLQVTP